MKYCLVMHAGENSVHKLSSKNPPPRDPILLHTCCADCALDFIASWQNSQAYSHKEAPPFTLYFDNSNIHPRSEWLARLNAVKTTAGELKLELIVADWSARKWFAEVTRQNMSDNAGLARCKLCWEIRLRATAQKARNLDFKVFSTTLLSSRFQSRKDIVNIGKRLAGKNLLFYTHADFENSTGKNSSAGKLTQQDARRKNRGGFYRQNYCGCAYSLVERYEEKTG